MGEWYSRADRERMAMGLDPLPHSELTAEDYAELLQMAMGEALADSPASGLVSRMELSDLSDQGQGLSGLTRPEFDSNDEATGRYEIDIGWSKQDMAWASDPAYAKAYMATKFSSVFHEVRHVEQNAMVSGDLDVTSKADMQVATQMTVNRLYPSLYTRSYSTDISEVDADVSGIEGARAFFAAHPELKGRYGFDFEAEMAKTDEYGVLDGKGGSLDDLLDGMKEHRDDIYDEKRTPEARSSPSGGEELFLDRLRSRYGITVPDLDGMDNDDRNVALLRAAKDVLDDPSNQSVMGNSMRMIKDSSVMRLDYGGALQADADGIQEIPDEAFSNIDAFLAKYDKGSEMPMPEPGKPLARQSALKSGIDSLKDTSLGKLFAAFESWYESDDRSLEGLFGLVTSLVDKGKEYMAAKAESLRREYDVDARFGHLLEAGRSQLGSMGLSYGG